MMSVVIPAFHARAFIGRALESVRKQTWTDWEILVVEDGPGDGTADEVASFAASEKRLVTLLGLSERCGCSVARNLALERSRGEIVAFLDADDSWEPSHLASLAASLYQGHAVAVSAVELWNANTNTRLVRHGLAPEWLAKPRSALFEQSIIHTASCVAVPRSTVARVGGFDPSMLCGEDRDYWFRALEGGRSLGFTGGFSARYVRHAANSTRNRRGVIASAINLHEKHQHAADIPPEVKRRALATRRRRERELQAAEAALTHPKTVESQQS